MGNGMIRKRESKFTQVSNSVAKDITLSLKAKGLYLLINSLLTIPDWVLYKNYVGSQCKEGDKAFESAWKELKKSGYLVQHKLQDRYGRLYYEYELLDEVVAKNHTPKNEVVEKAYVEKAYVEKAPPGLSTPGKRGVYNNTVFNNKDLNKILEINTNGNKKDTHTTPKNHMCTNDTSPENVALLRAKIKEITGYTIPLNKVKDMLNKTPLERIEYHLMHWPTHAKYQKGEGAGWFICVVAHDIEPVDPEVKYYSKNIPQRDAFNQREYTDEYLERFYAKLEE